MSNLREEATLQSQYFIAVFSAYVLVVYFAGKARSKTYLAILSVSYSLFILSPIMASRVALSNLTAVATRYAAEHPEAIVEHVIVDLLSDWGAGLFIFCWLLSLFFMLSHTKKSDT